MYEWNSWSKVYINHRFIVAGKNRFKAKIDFD